MHAEQATPRSAPVINFAETTTKQRPARKAAAHASHPDATLIESCIEYAGQIKAGEICYLIDPTDSDFAAFADDLARSRASRAMRQALDLAPVTMDGLRAKAAVVVLCIDDWGGELEDLHRRFLVSLAEDVIRFQRTLEPGKRNDVPVGKAT